MLDAVPRERMLRVASNSFAALSYVRLSVSRLAVRTVLRFRLRFIGITSPVGTMLFLLFYSVSLGMTSDTGIRIFHDSTISNGTTFGP